MRYIHISILSEYLPCHVCVQSCPTHCDPMDYSPTGFLCLWNFTGKNTGVGCHFFLQGTFLTQASNLSLLYLLHCRQIFLPAELFIVHIYIIASAAAKSLQSCPALCDPIDGSPPGSRIPGNLQARTLEWVAISFSNAWKWKVGVKLLSRVRLLATPWTSAHQAPPSIGFSRREDWSGVPLLSPFIWWVKVKLLSRVRLFAIPWTVAYQAPLSMEFSRQQFWSRLSFPSPEDLLNPGIKPKSHTLQADILLSEPPGKALYMILNI